MGRLGKTLFALLVAAGLIFAGWWAASVSLEPPEDPLGDPVPVEYTVTDGTVGRSLRFASVASWQFRDLARNASSGVVTSVAIGPGDEVSAGDVLYAVDLRPVVVAQGATPMFRDLGLNAEGPDVVQVQELLAVLEFYDGEIDGIFGSGVRAAVRDWQDALGLEDDGVVRRGDVVFVGSLPARVVLTDEVSVGAPLAGGEVVVRELVGDPEFGIPLSPEQRSLVPLSADVFVTYDGGVWPGRIVEAVEDELRGELRLILEAPGGGAVCGLDCAGAVPLLGESSFSTEIVVVPETEGPVVPVAGIVTDPDGSASVRLVDGEMADVTVVAVADGLAVVEGLSAGDVILLPVEESS
ncbi:MAG: peptidoglycan-binding domain-containing protein [Acidimicrobiia bacterium]